MSYFDTVIEKLNLINDDQTESMNNAAQIVSETIQRGGLIYIFGCGHSHLLAEDCFYRAGGLANVYPIFDEKLMLHESASYSSVLEKSEDSVRGIIEKYDVKKEDMLFVLSTSGINGSPVQMAINGKKLGIKVVGIGSSEYFTENSRHSSGKMLKDVVDVFIDNKVPHGDAVENIGGEVKAGPISTILSAFIMQNVILIAEKDAVKKGVQPDVFLSGNIKGGAEYNKSLIEKYKDKVDCL